MKATTAALAAVLIMALSPMPAASAKTVMDPRDASAGLDIKSAAARQVTENHREFWVFTVEMYDSFTNRDLRGAPEGHPPIGIHFQTDRDKPFDRVLVISSKRDATGFALFAEMAVGTPSDPWKYNTSNIAGYGKVWRPSATSVKVKIPDRLLGRGGIDWFRWAAQDTSRCGSGCLGFDYAPNGYRVTERG